MRSENDVPLAKLAIRMKRPHAYSGAKRENGRRRAGAEGFAIVATAAPQGWQIGNRHRQRESRLL